MLFRSNTVNSAPYSAYTTGGFLVYETPTNLNGVTAVLTIRDAPGTGSVLLILTNTSGIALDVSGLTITPTLATTGLLWTTGYYDLELTDAAGKVTQLLTGVITIV